jgi:metal-responsive CopG/Arc/MetJ family transcriptional regulator
MGITSFLAKQLNDMAQQRKVKKSVIIREAIDKFLTEATPNGEIGEASILP